MGYFGRIEKCARYYDSDARAYKWGEWKYTGSSAAGVDYVSNDGLSVVYRVPVTYAAEDNGLQAFAIWTNYVTPTSSGNPSTAYCYLYTSDPTGGRDADIATAPLGYEAFAGPISFDASHVGDYLGFNFAALSAKPAMLYFWFTSSVQYTAYGSNQIYHYATGNYDKLLNTGTRTPTITGGFPESGGSGGETGGGGYTVIASGSYTNIGYTRTFSYTRAERTASYTALSFTGGGTVTLSAERNGEYDNGLIMNGYLSRSADFNSASGKPTGSIVASATGSGSYSMDATVESGVTYYLWTVITQSGYTETPVNVSVKPTSWKYTIKDCGSRLNLAQQKVSFSMSVGTYQVGRMKVSFNYTANVDVTMNYSGEDVITAIYVSKQPDINSATGRPLVIENRFDPGANNFNVYKGEVYYLFFFCNGGLSSGTTSVSIVPPSIIWTLGSSIIYNRIAVNVARSISLANAKYNMIKLSFAYTGTAKFYTNKTTINDYRAVEGILSLSDDFDNHYGRSNNPLNSDCGSMEPTGSHDYSFSYRVAAGKTYYLFTKNAFANGPTDNTLSTTINIIPPPAPSGGYSLAESVQSLDISEELSNAVSLGCYSISRRELSFTYSGTAAFSAAVKASSAAEPQLRFYLSESEGIDLETGVPTGTILASDIGGGASAALECSVESRKHYYLFTVADMVYMEVKCPLVIDVMPPPPAYFKITQRGEFYAVEETVSFNASPGAGGVCLLELSFAKSGTVQITSSDTAGSVSFLRAYVGYLPSLDPLTGEPSAELIAEAAGSDGAPDYALSLEVEADTTYYLFSRDDWLYSAPGFVINIKPMPGSMRIMLGGAGVSARAYVYSQGVWRAALPMCHSSGAWHTGG